MFAPRSGTPKRSAPARPAPKRAASKAKFCTECGHKLLPNAKFCIGCGVKFSESGDVDDQEEIPQ